MPKKENLLNQTFGRLTVIGEADSYTFPGGTKRAQWHCQCECGNKVTVLARSLKSGNTSSCGCIKSEVITKYNQATKTTHGHAVGGKFSKTYICYHNMIQRCYNPENTSYSNYGAKGITLCDRWRYGEGNKSGFECFLEDMGEAPPGLSIDRVEVTGNYEATNCIWATDKEQANNKNSSKYSVSRTHEVQ